MKHPYDTRLEDWAEWFTFNQDRLRLYYQRRDVLANRYEFGWKALDGFYELIARVLERLDTQWHRAYEVHMPRELISKTQQDVAWFYRHKDTIIDPDIQFDFLLKAQAKVLMTLRLIGEEMLNLETGRTSTRDLQEVMATYDRDEDDE